MSQHSKLAVALLMFHIDEKGEDDEKMAVHIVVNGIFTFYALKSLRFVLRERERKLHTMSVISSMTRRKNIVSTHGDFCNSLFRAPTLCTCVYVSCCFLAYLIVSWFERMVMMMMMMIIVVMDQRLTSY